ncbi:beta-glucosidase [Exiguobacterium sp. SH3S2]|uniref:glycoside hydrolase family 3 C-terminal domain-containing protein n=1 Tax=unclassified Exiguobacterium TaxID=2644629 RepID=UPI001038ACBE|nr:MULTISPECIES: glycoside hydrolase family 3 C-terminal domain-containing protein [unclassified Exiguobacterium]TCI47409.1 beta-glucosidase [Exiguobacterium sp. SH3S3]TCI62556.1 beta-glucosidase [Exiguobacterium sp. SH3S2]
MKHYTLNWDTYKQLARTAVAEGAVLLKNEQTLPIEAGTTVSVFGRSQFNYYKSGTGSGGMVNVSHVTSPLEALQASEGIQLNESLLQTYEAWVEENPFDKGVGWAGEPWSQPEMAVTDALVAEAAAKSDMALIMIGRTAGEDRDNTADPGSYLLTEIENELIEKVSKAFTKTAVVLNVGNIIDMKWATDYEPSAILYAWQGGLEGGTGLVDVLTGKVSPSGKLTDTIARSIDDYPSTKNFGHADKGIYQEDIYVGYRYFETFAKDEVLYPFGFGLSYTRFSTEVVETSEQNGLITINVAVTNTGAVDGKEVVQLYVEKPQGVLGNPARALVAFDKTGLLAPGERQTLEFSVPVTDFASYDDRGVTGHASSFVLEAGTYRIHAGTDVRSAVAVFDYELAELQVVETLSENMAPVTPFDRIKPVASGQGYEVSYEATPLRQVDVEARYLAERPMQRHQTSDNGLKLTDVYHGKAELETFLDQLTDEDLACIVRGQGMNSPRVTPGTAAAFGGVSDRLNELDIPAACCADGPSGIRMDIGTKAFALPNGTLLASSFNVALIEDLFEMTGLEMRKNRVDTLLGPGMNIHRNPLNGRNFEYFSEDPHVTGKMAIAQLNGMHRVGVTGTLKHFSANNQEAHRHDIDSVVSERALREIYLKGFEMAVKEGKATSIMTTYGAVNGVWTAGLYDQNTRVLRDEWGFEGIVMTDWWAKVNHHEDEPANRQNTAAMVQSQNDLYMVVDRPDTNSFDDNTGAALAAGTLTRAELLRSAANICRFVLQSPAMERLLGLHDGSVEVIGLDEEAGQTIDFDVTYQHLANGESVSLIDADTSTGNTHVFAVSVDETGTYDVTITARSEAGELAQMPVTLFANNIPGPTFTFNGTGGEWVTQTKQLFFLNQHNYLQLYFTLGGLDVKDITFTLADSFSMKNG